MTKDLSAPTVTLSAAATTLAAGATSLLTFTLSEAGSGFVAAEVSLTGGSLSALTAAGYNYTAIYTAPATAGRVTLTVPANVFTDLAGNGNAPGNTLTPRGATFHRGGHGGTQHHTAGRQQGDTDCQFARG